MSIRSQRGRIGAHSLHAKHDSKRLTENGRTAFLARFEREVDPEGVLPSAERERRAKHARTAYFSRLATQKTGSRGIALSGEEARALTHAYALLTGIVARLDIEPAGKDGSA